MLAIPFHVRVGIMWTSVIICALAPSVTKHPEKIQDLWNKCKVNGNNLIGGGFSCYTASVATMFLGFPTGTLLSSCLAFQITNSLMQDVFQTVTDIDFEQSHPV
jgi:hypothetical protein